MTNMRKKAEGLPAKPGIYFFKNAKGEVVYIGKARDLRDRVKSYFQPTEDVKVRNILAEAEDIDYILTDSEREAAFLENNFVQQIQPKFNLRLKDDKSFPYLRVAMKEPFPGVSFGRRVAADGARYFGPFSPAREARRTIHLLGKYFRLRNCAEEIPGKRKRPCLEYDLNLCSAPCVGFVREDDYRDSVANALLFLEGRTDELGRNLADRMRRAAAKHEFEEAARLRDIIATLEHIKVKPKLISVGLENQDIFGHARAGGARAVIVFIMRQGKVRELREIVVREEEGRPDAETLGDIIAEFYAAREIPGKILVPFEPAGKDALAASLAAKAGRKVEIAVPERGKKRSLLDLAARNAESVLRKRAESAGPLDRVRQELGLAALPVRIEGFDVSNTGGTETVAALVTFVNGRPDKDGYRKFKVKTVEGPNDVASLREVIRRRYVRVLEEGRPLPDLILVDGGRPQLGAAGAALAALGLGHIPLASLAKREDIIFTREAKTGIRLDRTSPALKLLQHVRDEAHRFAVKFHRQRREKRSFD